MKIKSKALLLALCAVLLVVASVLTTLSYLTDTKEVKNVFTVGNVKITLDEAKVNTSGEPLKKAADTSEDVPAESVAAAYRVTANEYKLQPGKTYTKDPTIHVDQNSEPCFLFVKIDNGLVQTIESTAVNIEAATQTDGYKTIADQMAALGWVEVTGADLVDGIYAYVGTADGATLPLQVAGSTDIAIFKEFKIADSVDGTTLANFDGSQITVTAYAVQASGFEGKSAAAKIIAVAFPGLVKQSTN